MAKKDERQKPPAPRVILRTAKPGEEDRKEPSVIIVEEPKPEESLPKAKIVSEAPKSDK